MGLLDKLMRGNEESVDEILAKDGDKEAFIRLINKNRMSLYRIGKSIVRNEEDIEDALQDTIMKAYRGIGNLKNPEYFKTWLIRIMINECNDIIRRNKKITYIEDVLPMAATKENSFERMEILDAIDRLDKDLKMVTLLYYYEDIPQKDIGEILNIPHATVRTRISRAREKLKQMLQYEEVDR